MKIDRGSILRAECFKPIKEGFLRILESQNKTVVAFPIAKRFSEKEL